jgi:hypothetical protein
MSGWRVAGCAVRPTVSEDVIQIAVTLVRAVGGDDNDGPLIADLLENFHRELPSPGRHVPKKGE